MPTELQLQFIRERRYLKAVSNATEQWYISSFKAFAGCSGKSEIVERIAQLRGANSAISVNTYLRAMNAYFMWLHKEHGKSW